MKSYYHISLVTIWLLCTLDNELSSALSSPIVSTGNGVVRGVSVKVLGKQVDQFLGIPYAKPPVGALRFRPPVNLVGWQGVLNATTLPNSCMQALDTTFGDFFGSTMWNANTKLDEDCLYLSIWVPKSNPPYGKKAVLVFIYGGSFFGGSHTLDIYNPSYLTAENDVIFVGIQYRVGALGFLAMDTPDAPGNAGLWDQKMALKWVHNNIRGFGGDPNRVTLVGESAGAGSIGLHLLNGVSENLFQGAILQSGAPEAPWCSLDIHEMWKRSTMLAKRFGCQGSDHTALVECLRSKNAREFPLQEFYVSTGTMQFAFVPVIDGIFLLESPRELVRKGLIKRVPLLLGSNTNEATFFLVYGKHFNRENQINRLTHREYKGVLQSSFKFYPTFPNELNTFGHEAIRFHYTDWLNAKDEVGFSQSIDKAVSDAYFVCPVNRLARSYSIQDLPVYYYWFDQRWSANPWPEWMGVLHGDEFWFSFGQALNDSHSFTPEERMLSRTMMRYWTNFAKTGNPNQAEGESPTDEWPRFRVDNQRYINLSTTTLTSGDKVGQGPRTQSCAFWDNYLPTLIDKTNDIARTESDWEAQFNTWKTKYITDWKHQFESFINQHRGSTPTCRTKNNNK